IIVPVSWLDYLMHRAEIKKANSPKLLYVCYWYTPKILYSFFGWFMWLSVLIGLNSHFRGFRPEVVLGSWAYPDGFAAAQLAKRFDCPYYIKVHGSDINILASEGRRRNIIGRICGNAKGVFSVSKALATKLSELGVSEDRVCQVYNGVDQKLFYPLMSADIDNCFLYVGNLKRDKGVLDLLNAYFLYRDAGGDKELKFIGGGAMTSELVARSKNSSYSKFIEFLGPKPHGEAATYIRSCACLVLPSYHEGVPNVLLESICSGVPVIATKVGGIPEVVKDKVSGLLVEPGDVLGLSEAMSDRRLNELGSKNEIATLGAQYSWEDNISQVEAFLNRV
ncbi:glycosyltransferase, partial [Oleiphilus sp. HI0117]|uniref:glycosyltransferase n=2 Tax=Oleiphilus TaxID=141450 RepID=UPI000B292B9F